VTAAKAAESGATKVIGEAGVTAVKETAAKAAEIGGTKIPLPSFGGKGKLADTWADDFIPVPDEAIAAPKTAAAPKAGARPAAPEPVRHGNPSMTADELAPLAKNPPVRTNARPDVAKDFYQKPIHPESRLEAGEFMKSHQEWLKKPASERQALDQGMRDCIDEAAAMGNKWAKRLQQDLNNGTFKYNFEPGIKGYGLAPGEGTALLNPMNAGAMNSPERMASTLVHEYAHSYKGPVKWAALEGKSAPAGTWTKGEYGEVRAFMSEGGFLRDLENARLLNGKSFDPLPAQELGDIMGVNSVQGSNKFARGAQMRDNTQKGILDMPEYNYANPDLAAERISRFRGGSMTDIRERLRTAKLAGDAEYQRVLNEIQTTGGRTQ